jgi:membrane protease YdiL (CAAX protease family)
LRTEDNSVETWDRIQMLIFVLVCPLFLLDRLSGLLFSVPSWWRYRSGILGFNVYVVLADVVTASLLVFVATLILGESGRKRARFSLRLLEPRFAFFGLMLPVLISLTISLLQYGHDRVQWAANDFGRISPPQFASYFSLGASWHWTLVLMVFAAFAEEIVFRGMLLPSLLRRYGLHRGVFLTGLIWAAFHFHGDMHLRYSMGQALLQLASRIAICLAMNYVLSWMTLRWNSVIPAAIAHTVSNVLVVGGINGGIPYAYEMRIALWGVCALVLFRYWPPREMAESGSKTPAEVPIQPEASQIE